MELAPDQQVTLLSQRFRFLLKRGKSRQARTVFTRIEAVTEAHGLKKDAVDVHMLFGDHVWDKSKEKTEAVKSYTAALVLGAAVTLEVMIQVGMHTVQRLLTLAPDDRLAQIERITSRVKAWLDEQQGATAHPDTVAFVLWPLRVALRVAATPTPRIGVSAQAMIALISDELLSPTQGRV